MDDMLYGCACTECGGLYNAVEHPVTFDPEALARGLREIYDGLDVKNVIERFIFEETLRLFNEAAAKGMAESEYAAVASDEFIRQIRTNNAVFSAFRVHRMQNDVARQLIDGDGKLKSFDRWMQDIEGMTNHYVRNWLQSEYSTAVIRAHRAVDWKHFETEQDVLPNLRWMPTTSPNQDPLHRQYWEKKLTLPVGHPFWDDHHPGDRWNCKCTLMQTDEPANDELVRSLYPVPAQPGLENNPAKDGRIFSDTHPYFTQAYPGAKRAVKTITDDKADDIQKRLAIDPQADATELEDNTRGAISILKSFPKTRIVIKGHSQEPNKKNPEYLIDGLVADRKGVRSENGIASGFQKAIEQGCRAVVIDLDKNMHRLNERRLGTHIQWRSRDFETGTIQRCYVIYNDRAVLITKDDVEKKTVSELLKRLKP